MQPRPLIVVSDLIVQELMSRSCGVIFCDANCKGEASMTEVREFLYSNPDVGSSFREFALNYETLSDVWTNCPRPDWMLDLLKRRNYRDAEKVEPYIDA